ncbi:MAG TPA: fibronectin type III domain-containing protein, partial [Mycobacteriales bacterium]|nr:fibronectin type III domain-containing protein [Mycobacteriales bacterium]
VAVTLTAVAPTATGGLVAHPWGSARPAVASLSFTARQNTTTLVVVRPGTGNHAAVYNSAGTTHVVADLIGYFSTLTVPPPPTAVLAAPGDGTAALSWTAPAAPTALPVTGYRITAAPGGASAVVGAVSAFEAGGLANGTAYRFAVAARNAFGYGPPSPLTAAVVPTAPTVPGPVASVTATAGYERALVEWAAPDDDGGGTVTDYVITTTPETAVTTVSADARSATVTGLVNGTPYQLHVAARNVAGTGASVSSPTVTPAVTVPAAPGQVTAAPGGDGVLVGWSPPVDDGGSAVTGYAVTVSPGDTTVAAGPADTSVTVPGLTAGTAYTFAVSAANAVGMGVPSTSAAVDPAVTVGAETVVLSAASLAALTAAHTDGSLEFTDAPNQVLGLAPGAVVVAGESEHIPAGLLGVVTAVTTTDQVTVVATRPASLDEALDDGSFSAAGAPAAPDAAFTPAVTGVRMLAATSRTSPTLRFAIDSTLYKDRLGHTIAAHGSVSITPDIHFDASIHCCFHTSSHFTATVTATAKLSLTAEVSHDIKGGIKLGTVRLGAFVVEVGPVPLLITPTLTLTLAASGTVTAGVTTTASAAATLGVALTTADGDVNAEPIRRWTTGYTPPTLYGSVHAKAGVQATLNVTVNGIPGPYLRNDLWLVALDADITKDPWWTLSLEDQLSAGFELKMLGHTLASWERTLLHVSIPYAKAGGPFNRIVIAPNPAGVVPGQIVRLTASVAGLAADHITWTVNGGTIGPDGVFTAPAEPGTYTVIASRPAEGLTAAAGGLASIRVGPQPPGAPAAVTATADAIGAALVGWSPPGDTGGGPVTGYTVTASPGGTTMWTDGSATTATVTGLTGGTGYTFTVTATTAAGTSADSEPSNPVLATDSGLPGNQVALTPIGTGSRPQLSGNGRYVTWVDGWRFYRYDTATGDTIDLLSLFGRDPTTSLGPAVDDSGSTVAWWESTCPKTALVVGDVTTGIAREVARTPSSCSDGPIPPRSPDLSADGRLLLFWGVPAGTEIVWDGWACATCKDYLYDTATHTYEQLPPPTQGRWMRLSGDGRKVLNDTSTYDRASHELHALRRCGPVSYMSLDVVSFDGSLIGGHCDDFEIRYSGYLYRIDTDQLDYYGELAYPLAIDRSGATVVDQHGGICGPDLDTCTPPYGTVSGPSGRRYIPGAAHGAALSGDGRTLVYWTGEGPYVIALGHL